MLAQASPAIKNTLINIALDPKVKGYSALIEMQNTCKTIQSGIIDRENNL